MAKLARVTQPIFAGNAPQEDTAVFGTMKTTPVYTSDVATSIDTTAFANGWKDAVEVGYAPFLEEMNTVQKAFSYQVAYNQQQGISEWGDDVEYNIGSFVKVNTANGSQVYSSLADNNVGNLVSDNTKWKLVLDSTVDYATVAQLNTKANNNAVVHTTGNESISGTKTFNNIIYAAAGATADSVVTTKELSASTSGSSGYFKLGNGLKIMWGGGTVRGSTWTNINLPASFDSTNYRVIITDYGTTSSSDISTFKVGDSKTKSAFSLLSSASVNVTSDAFTYIAIGF